MNKCPGCAAPTDPSSLVCRFCGVTCQEIISVSDELRALQELHRASQEMARGSGISNLFGAMGSNMMNNLGGGPQARIARFWQNAFIPRTIEAQCQAVIQMIGMIVVPDGMMQAMQESLQHPQPAKQPAAADEAEHSASMEALHEPARMPSPEPAAAAAAAKPARQRRAARRGPRQEKSKREETKPAEPTRRSKRRRTKT